jgi:quercetin dioxygenase-like cupin family protein
MERRADNPHKEDFMRRHTPLSTLLAAIALLWLTAPAIAQAPHGSAMTAAHAAELDWRDGPASLPPGARIVVLAGNPAEEGPLTFRLQLPPNYRVPPHLHPAIEHLTILSGTFYVGMGESFDRAAATALPAGSFAVIPNGHVHFAFTGNEPVTVQLHSDGPWGITYLDPADDPRRR